MTPRRRRFVVCEDGREYIDRFTRFLGEDFDFVPAQDFEAAQAALAAADGLLLDLDFRRTASGKLVDAEGPAPMVLDAGTRDRLSETQGILILRRLRAAGVKVPAILFADIADPAQTSYLERTLAPLVVASSRLGIRAIAALMRAAR